MENELGKMWNSLAIDKQNIMINLIRFAILFGLTKHSWFSVEQINVRGSSSKND